MSGSIYDSALRYRIDPLLLRAQAIVESGENDDAISPAGASGRMQFMPATAAEYGVKNPKDPKQSVPAAAAKMSDLLDQHGDLTKALMAYNAGHPSRWNNPETLAYPGKVAAEYRKLAQVQNTKKDDFSDILDMPVKDSKPANQDYSDILDMPVKDQPSATRFIPTQEMGPIPDNDVVGQSTGKPVRGDAVPGAMTQAAASFSTDPTQRIRIYASRIFPDIPLDQATKRFFYENGRLAAVSKEGQPFYVEPDTFGRGDVPIYRQNWAAITPGYLAQAAGPALPVAGGIAGGAVAAPTSVTGGPALAAGGAAIGDATRQFIANYLDPTGGLPYDYLQTAREAALAGAGQVGSGLVARGLAPNALAVPQSEIRLARTGNALGVARDAYERAGAQGVDLTPGQASGLPSLLAYEDVAARNPLMTDRARQFYQMQQQQLSNAGQSMLGEIAPAMDATDAALKFQQGAQPAITGLRQRANAAARPAYDAAQNVGNVMTPDLAQLSEIPAVQNAMTKARAEYANMYRQPAPDVPDFRLWDLTKRALDDAHGKAAKEGDRTGAMAIDSLRGDLSARLDEAFPTYAQARAIAAPGQRAAARLEDTAAGKIADMSGGETARPILAPMFEKSNPETIKATRDAFLEAGQGDAWYSGVRSYIQSAIDKASQSQDGLNAAMLRRNVWANNDVRKAMEAAMTPEQYQGFTRFMTTIEDVARTMPMNSLTQPRQMAEAALKDAAGNTMANKLVRGAGMLTSPNTLLRGGSVITDKIDNWITGRNIQTVVGNLFSPNGMQMLEDMARVSPGSNQARAAAIQILTRAAPELPAADDATNLLAPSPTNRLAAPR